jgi:hypothetical protein
MFHLCHPKKTGIFLDQSPITSSNLHEIFDSMFGETHQENSNDKVQANSIEEKQEEDENQDIYQKYAIFPNHGNFAIISLNQTLTLLKITQFLNSWTN